MHFDTAGCHLVDGQIFEACLVGTTVDSLDGITRCRNHESPVSRKIFTGNLEATDEEIVEAAKAANVDDYPHPSWWL